MSKNFVSSDSLKNKPLIILSMLMVLFAVLPEALLLKLAHLGFVTFSVPVLIVPFFFCIGDIVAEIYGLKTARFIIVFAIFCDISFSLIIMFLILLPAPESWHYQQYFDYVYGHSLQLSFIGALGIYLGQYINTYMLNKWRILLRGKYFWMRSIGASGIGEFIITLFTYTFVFKDVANNSTLLKLAISSYIIKLMITGILSYPASLLITVIKHYEKKDIYDYNTRLNPLTKK